MPSEPVALSLQSVDKQEQETVINIITIYLGPEPLAEAPGYHASGVGLDGQHGSEAAAERLPEEEAPAAGLDQGYAVASDPVAPVELPGPADSLQADETGPHLKDKNGCLKLIVI